MVETGSLEAMRNKTEKVLGSRLDKLQETIDDQNTEIDERIHALLLFLRSRNAEEETLHVGACPASAQLSDSPDFNHPEPKPKYVVNVAPNAPKASSPLSNQSQDEFRSLRMETNAQAQKHQFTRMVEKDLSTCVEKLEVTIEEKISKIEKQLTDVCEAIPLLSRSEPFNHGVSNQFRSPQAAARFSLDLNFFEKRSGISNTYPDATQPEKVAFPRFNGDKIQEWLLLVEQFFEIYQTPDEFKVCLASIHFDGLATAWHKSISQSVLWENVRCNWGIYKMLLQGKYFKLEDDVIAELKLLHETEGIEEYHAKFELIQSRVSLSEAYLVSVYLDGLSFDTQQNVRKFQPQTIQQCLKLGRLYEYVPSTWL